MPEQTLQILLVSEAEASEGVSAVECNKYSLVIYPSRKIIL